MKLRLRFPHKEHTLEDLKPLFEEFRALHPEVFEEWREREKRRDITLENSLKPTSLLVRAFLKERTDWDSNSALTGAFFDFRRLMARSLFHH